jgi:hypothetical protein
VPTSSAPPDTTVGTTVVRRGNGIVMCPCVRTGSIGP